MNLTKTCKSFFLSNKKDFIYFTLAIISCFLVGLIISACVVIFAGETTYVSVGTITGLIGGIVMLFVCAGNTFSNDFETALKMGITRRNYAISASFFTLILSYFVLLLTLALSLVEKLVITLALPTMPFEVDFSLFLSIPIAFAVPLLIPILFTFFGLMLHKFGVVGFWVLWVIWMTTCLGVPNLFENIEQKNTASGMNLLFYNMLMSAKSLSLGFWLAVVGLILFAIIVCNIVWTRKFVVKN